jgi:hypothetical protein
MSGAKSGAKRSGAKRSGRSVRLCDLEADDWHVLSHRSSGFDTDVSVIVGVAGINARTLAAVDKALEMLDALALKSPLQAFWEDFEGGGLFKLLVYNDLAAQATYPHSFNRDDGIYDPGLLTLSTVIKTNKWMSGDTPFFGQEYNSGKQGGKTTVRAELKAAFDQLSFEGNPNSASKDA